MSHHADFTDGVPVKLSDKYKRPPSVDLPYSVAETEARARALVDAVRVDPGREREALARVQAMRAGRAARCRERAHRLRVRDEAHQLRLDSLAAAEAEERLRQLCVSEVSYPSADDLCAPDEPSQAEAPCGYAADILRPVRAPARPRAVMPDDPDPLRELKTKARLYRPPRCDVEGLTFSDFENDTSSPFDNEELKTLNEMELLAQVLDPAAVLPPPARALCRSVHALGFPLRRVVRVCSSLGDDRDGVVRGLLVMGELLALGFPEARVCEALERAGYDRERALRELAA